MARLRQDTLEEYSRRMQESRQRGELRAEQNKAGISETVASAALDGWFSRLLRSCLDRIDRAKPQDKARLVGCSRDDLIDAYGEERTLIHDRSGPTRKRPAQFSDEFRARKDKAADPQRGRRKRSTPAR
jgi:hypothetical protein